MRPIYRLLTIASLFSPATMANELLHWKTPTYIEDSFIEIALGREYAQRSTRLEKWPGQITVFIDDITGDRDLHRSLTWTHLDHLFHITGQVFKPANKAPDAKLLIHFTTEQTFVSSHHAKGQDAIIRSSVCLAKLRKKASTGIIQAEVWIPVDRARAHAKLLACIVEELTQSLGLINDTQTVFPSIFNDHSHNDFLTGLDFILLKLLYDPKIHSGQTEAEMRVVIKALLATPEYQRYIQQAEYLVQQHSLENILKQ
jgi:hypothetical protein